MKLIIIQTHKAYNRVRESNFMLDGLVGFDVHGKTGNYFFPKGIDITYVSSIFFYSRILSKS